MLGSSQQGRTRVIVTALLVLLIGAVGALILPRLLQEAGKTVSTSVRGHVCLDVPPDGLARAGDIGLVVEKDDGRTFTWGQRFLAGASHEEIREVFAQQIEDAAAAVSTPPDLSEGCLPVGRVLGLGGDPGASGAGLAFGLAAALGEHLRLRVAIQGGPAEPAGPAWRSEVGFVAWGEADSAEFAIAAGWDPAEGVLATVASALREKGWGVADTEAGSFTLYALPGGGPIDSLLLTVRCEPTVVGDTEPPEDTYLWTLGVR